MAHPSSYGVFVSLAHLFAVTAVLCTVRAKKLPLEPFVDLLFVVLICGLIGARGAYILEYSGEFSSPLDWLKLWRGGLSVFGGLALAVPAYLAWLWRKKLPLWSTSDLLTPILPFSLGIIRLGCLAAGCCYGKPTTLPWGIHSDIGGEHLIPTQALEAVFLFLLAGALFYFSRKERHGLIATGFFLAYAFYRLLTNPLRGDLQRVGSTGISVAQIGAAVLFCVAAALFTWRYHERRKKRLT